jgi:thymidylate synthase (FAD)
MAMIKVTYVDHMGSDLSVVNAARVSFGKKSDWEGFPVDKKLSERDARLIAYLARENHKSPFNHAFATFHVKAPVFVARQLVKHEYMPWNEISRRYVDEEPEFYVPDTWRGRSADKKQGSEGVVNDINPLFVSDMKVNALEDYDYLLSQGVCPEQARMVLPQSMMTEWFWSGSLHAIAKMCSLRLKPDTQQETREVAIQVDEHMERLFPVSWKELAKSF